DQGAVMAASLGAYQNDLGEGVMRTDVHIYPLILAGTTPPFIPTNDTGEIALNSDEQWPDGVPLPLRRQHVFYPYDGTSEHVNDTSIFQTRLLTIAGTGWGTDTMPRRNAASATQIIARNGHRFDLGDSFAFSRGVAPNCKLAGFKVLDGTGSGTLG